MPLSWETARFSVERPTAIFFPLLGFRPVGCWMAVMLGDIGIAAVSVFLILVWTSAAAVIATVALYRLHFRKAFAIAAYSGLISLALAVWAYFSIWGHGWGQ